MKRVRIFGADDGEHLDLVRDGDEASWRHYKMLPTQATAQQTTWSEVPWISLPWKQLVEAVKELGD